MNDLKPSWKIVRQGNIITFYETDEKVGDLLIKCTYDITTEHYTEHCWNKNNPTYVKTKSWKRRGFKPIFGIDEIDWTYSYRIADELGHEFDKEAK